MLNKGYGAQTTKATLKAGFEDSNLARIFLKVRTDLSHRIKLYEDIGFIRFGSIITKKIDGKDVQFHEMQITKAQYESTRGKPN